jgi:hypothetical protein
MNPPRICAFSGGNTLQFDASANFAEQRIKGERRMARTRAGTGSATLATPQT